MIIKNSKIIKIIKKWLGCPKKLIKYKIIVIGIIITKINLTK